VRKIIKTIQKRYSSSAFVRLTLWLYTFGILVFSLNLSSNQLQEAWLFAEQNSETLTAAVLTLGFPLWFILYSVHKSNKHDFKQRKMRLKYRTKCYQNLENCVYPQNAAASLKSLETSIRDIQIFGEDDERSLAENLAVHVQKTGGYKFQDIFNLLLAMRRHMRDDLGLDALENDTYFTLRMATPLAQPKQKASSPVAAKATTQAKAAPKLTAVPNKTPQKKKATVTKKTTAKKTAVKKASPKTKKTPKKVVKKATKK